jgi:hypothetical protein
MTFIANNSSVLALKTLEYPPSPIVFNLEVISNPSQEVLPLIDAWR